MGVRALVLSLVVFASVAFGGLAACNPNGRPPIPGVRAYQPSQQWVGFPMGLSVNTMQGNVHVRRVDLSIDTRIGHWPIVGVYNSASGTWQHNFDMKYDGSTFTDDTGAVFSDLDTFSNNDRIPGSKWVKVSGSQLKTLGGLVYSFANGVISSVHWAGASYPRLVFDRAMISGEWRVTDIRQCTGASNCTNFFEITHSQGRVTGISDRANRNATFTYDAEGRLQTARDGKDVAEGLPGFEYSYDSAGLLWGIENSETDGIIITYNNDEGRAEQIFQVDEEWAITTFGYPAHTATSYFTNVTDPTGATTNYRFDALRRLRRVTLPTGERADYTWTNVTGNNFRVASYRHFDDVTTTWTYPNEDTVEEHRPTDIGINTVVTEFQPYGSSRSNRSTPSERPLIRVSDSLGAIAEFGYASNGRLAWQENGEGERTTFTYTGNAHLQTTTSPSGVVTTLRDYGQHGHPREIEFDGTTDALTYDTVGNRLTSSSLATPTSAGRPGIVRRAFDADRNLVQMRIADFDGVFHSFSEQSINITYRSDGKMLYVDRPGGGDHRFVYDDLGRLDQVQEYADWGWRTTNYDYHPDGRVAAVNAPNGMRTEMDYDASRRPSATRYYRNGVFDRSVSYEYTNGQLTTKTDSSYPGPETFSYDSAGLVDQITFPRGEQLYQSYDLRNREVVRSYVSHTNSAIRTIGFGFDLAGRLVGAYDGLAQQILSRSIVDGQLVSETFGNGLTRTYDYRNATGELQGSETRTAGGTLRERTTITRDGLWFSSIDQEIQTQTWGGVARTTTEEFFMSSEDSAYGMRIVSDEGPGGRAFSFDHAGNIGEPFNNSYNNQRNRIQSGSGNSYLHDTAGFVTSRGPEGITWQANGLPSSIGNRTFVWDAEGRPISRVLNGTTTNYRFGGLMRSTAVQLYGTIELGFAKLDVASGQWMYRHMDFRGNVKFVTDNSGNVVLHHKYDGYAVANSWGSGDDDRTFAQGEDLGDGLIMLGARVYDSDIGRFLSQDPIFNLVNQYAYTLGNPYWLWDPDGRHATSSAETGGMGDVGNTGAAIATGGSVIAGLGRTVAFAAIFYPPAAAAGTVLTGIGGFFVVVGGVLVAIDKANGGGEKPSGNDAGKASGLGTGGGDAEPGGGSGSGGSGRGSGKGGGPKGCGSCFSGPGGDPRDATIGPIEFGTGICSPVAAVGASRVDEEVGYLFGAMWLVLGAGLWRVRRRRLTGRLS